MGTVIRVNDFKNIAGIYDSYTEVSSILDENINVNGLHNPTEKCIRTSKDRRKRKLAKNARKRNRR